MAGKNSFATSYMILSPEKFKLVDLTRILFSSDLDKMRFVDSSKAKEESFEHRWLIFNSIVAQILLRFFSKPMAVIGFISLFFLNLLSSNGGFVQLLLNTFLGKLVIPKTGSASFMSLIGYLDKRNELDNDIKRGDVRYHAFLSMMASKISYENEAYIQSVVNNNWKMEFLGSHSYWNDFQGKATTQAFLLRDKDTIVVTFRGTEPFNLQAWCSDVDISWYELPTMGRIHEGFMKALGLQRNIGWPKQIDMNSKEIDPMNTECRAPPAYYAIREMLREIMTKNENTKFIVTGHSLGGALAVLFPAILGFHEENMLLERLEGVYTFGQPRVGDNKFGEYMENLLTEYHIDYYRFVYCNDIVPRLPFDNKALVFNHFGTCIYFDRNYHGKIVQEEPNKNYFSPLASISMKVNAAWELVRSYTLPRTKGPEYKEGHLMRIIRVLGLVIPGLSAHSPSDYVNSTRLISADVFPSKHYFGP